MDIELEALEVAEGRIAVLEMQVTSLTEELGKQVAATRKLSNTLEATRGDLAEAVRELNGRDESVSELAS